MATERPLEEARKRIEARKKEEIIIPGNPIEVPPSIPEAPYNEIAKERFVFNIVPHSVTLLIADVAYTIENREKITLVSDNRFDFSTKDTRKIERLLDKGKNPIKSGTFSYNAEIIEKGDVHERIVFGPVSPIKEKAPDRTYRICFEVKYDAMKKTIDWIMGDKEGPVLNWEPKKDKEKGYRLSVHDGHVGGNISYSELNMLTLAEDLVAQIDLGRYKYQVREIPIMRLQEG
jgi:hypothetical protein